MKSKGNLNNGNTLKNILRINKQMKDVNYTKAEHKINLKFNATSRKSNQGVVW